MQRTDFADQSVCVCDAALNGNVSWKLSYTVLETLEWQLTVFSVYNFGHLSSYSHVRAETDVFKVFLLPGIWPLSVKMTSRVAKREKREAIKTVAPDLV